jgi:hypothetical protein
MSDEERSKPNWRLSGELDEDDVAARVAALASGERRYMWLGSHYASIQRDESQERSGDGRLIRFRIKFEAQLVEIASERFLQFQRVVDGSAHARMLFRPTHEQDPVVNEASWLEVERVVVEGLLDEARDALLAASEEQDPQRSTGSPA